MNVSVVRVKPARRERALPVASLIAALGVFAIGWLEIGAVTTIIIGAVAAAGLVTGIRWYSSRGLGSRSHSPDGGLSPVDASVEGRPGKLRVLPDRLEWTPTRGECVTLHEATISEIQLREIRLVRSTRMTLLRRDGSQTHVTVTAPLRALEQALAPS